MLMQMQRQEQKLNLHNAMHYQITVHVVIVFHNFRTEQNEKKITFVNVILNYAQDINKRIKLENKIHECE